MVGFLYRCGKVPDYSFYAVSLRFISDLKWSSTDISVLELPSLHFPGLIEFKYA